MQGDNILERELEIHLRITGVNVDGGIRSFSQTNISSENTTTLHKYKDAYPGAKQVCGSNAEPLCFHI